VKKSKKPRYGPAPTRAAASETAGAPSHEDAGRKRPPVATAAPAQVRGKKGKPAKKKPKMPNLDPNDAAIWQESARLAQEGNTKLARACDILREGLQMLVFAEFDHSTKPPTPMTSSMFRVAIAEILDTYSRITGQSWRNPRNQVVKTRAGKADGDLSKSDRSLNSDTLVTGGARDYD
jgi:hypothetical protein